MAGLAGSFTRERPLVLVGAGKMGGALLGGWLAAGLEPGAIIVVDPASSTEVKASLRRARVRTFETVPTEVTARVVVVAVKPQVIGAVLPGLRPIIGRATTLLSVAAGTTLTVLAAGSGHGAVIRSIPNTPAQLGRGITAAIAGDLVSKRGRQLAGRVLAAVGQVVWVDRESLIDAVTAVSGSGPAYVFLLAETLASAGVAAGLDRQTAEQLARATVAGSGELLHRSGLTAQQLRKNVTSPNGTTAAALALLMGPGGLAPLMKKAVAAAKRRSRELSG